MLAFACWKKQTVRSACVTLRTMTNIPSPPPLAPPVSAMACGGADMLMERTDGALRKLEKALETKAGPGLIHEVRKTIKDYRALLRLVKSDEARQARKAAAQAARTLSAARDRQAAREAILDLAQSGVIAPEDGMRAVDAIGTDEASSADVAAGLDALKTWVTDARRLHAEVLNAQLQTVDLARGLGEGYDKARKATDWKKPEGLHDLRKRVVTHRYQMSFFARIHKGVGASRARRAQRLRETLGTIQDIEALGQVLDGLPHPIDPALRQRIVAGGLVRQKQLGKEARHQHRLLFGRKAKALIARVKRRWPPKDDISTPTL